MTTLTSTSIHLQCRDVNAARNWYETHLGIRPLDESSGRVTLDVAPFPIVLVPARIQLAMSTHLGWGAEIQVEVEDLDGLYAAARVANCVKEPMSEDGSFVFADGDGYRLRVRAAA